MPEKGEPMPELSARRNIVVIADEAHRSQYDFGGKVNVPDRRDVLRLRQQPARCLAECVVHRSQFAKKTKANIRG